MRKQIIIAAIGLAALYSCKHEVITSTGSAGGNTGGNTGTDTSTNAGGGNPVNAICFEADILPLFQSSCAKSGCHNATSRADGYVFDSYNNIVKEDIRPGNAEGSKVYKMITETDPDKRMPPPPNAPLSAAQIDLIKRWINEGAKNTTGCASACNTSTFTYSQAVKPILDANCAGCHNGPGAGGGIVLTTYNGVRTVALNGRLSGAINHQQGFSPMPKGGAKLSDCNITQITKWIQAGAPNN